MFETIRDVKSFEIKRSGWIRGEQAYGDGHKLNSSLLTKNGQRCCLGFFCLAAGVPDDQMFLKGTPRWVEGIKEFKDVEFLLFAATVNPLMRINDDKDLDDTKREMLISNIFAVHGYLPVFVD